MNVEGTETLGRGAPLVTEIQTSAERTWLPQVTQSTCDKVRCQGAWTAAGSHIPRPGLEATENWQTWEKEGVSLPFPVYDVLQRPLLAGLTSSPLAKEASLQGPVSHNRAKQQLGTKRQ